MVWPALADYRSRSDIQGCQPTGSAMALIVVSSTLGLPRQHRQDGLATAERLDLTFLIDAQHDRVMGWVHIQPDDVSHLVDQQRIIGQLEGLAAMRTQPERPPDPTDRGLTESRPQRQGSTAPVGGSFGNLLESETYRLLDPVIPDLARGPRPRFVA